MARILALHVRGVARSHTFSMLPRAALPARVLGAVRPVGQAGRLGQGAVLSANRRMRNAGRWLVCKSTPVSVTRPGGLNCHNCPTGPTASAFPSVAWYRHRRGKRQLRVWIGLRHAVVCGGCKRFSGLLAPNPRQGAPALHLELLRNSYLFFHIDIVLGG